VPQIVSQSTSDIGLSLDAAREELAEAVVDRHYRRRPELEARYGEFGRKKCRVDAASHLTYLAQALAASEPALFREYVAWAKVMLGGRGIPASDLADNLQITIEVLKDRLSADDAAAACRCIEAAIANLPAMRTALPSFLASDQPLAELAQSYLAALLRNERQRAGRMILDAVDKGTSIKDVYMHVFQRSQHEVGRLWQANQISVAQEHYCTAVTQMVMSQLYPRIFAGPRIGRRFVGACVTGDLHELGIRMIADFFEMEGWDTVYLGASVPTSDLVRTLRDQKPDVLGISATITPHIGAVAQLVTAVRATPDCGDIKILVGGYPFLIAPELWKELHADGTCLDARGAVELANHLIRN